ncbi:AraC family transcriptional regulator [Ectopseudomonas mendocina]|uniref:AraC family transcriptional regulator n=1 Tax=Ectopseudomonas mendocina TaxID=300 RepID=A0ABZ2RMF9_ECTME
MHLFTCGQLSAAANALGGDVRFDADLPGDMPVLNGQQNVQTADNGLVLYLSHSQDLVDGCSRNLLSPGLTASVLLEGQADISLPGQRWYSDARRSQNRAMLLNLTDSEQFTRHWQAGRHETKLSLHITPQWLDQYLHSSADGSKQLRQLAKNHLHSQPWLPAANLLQRAQQLEPTATLNPVLRRLQRESLALELAVDILQGIEATIPGKRLSNHLQQRLERLKDWLDSGTANHLSIAQMARELSSNPVDLQKGFRQLYGDTIAAYLRKARLEQAYQALCQQRISVDDAASLAGYEHLSSFSNAFRRQYGIAPSQARK